MVIEDCGWLNENYLFSKNEELQRETEGERIILTTVYEPYN